MSTTRPLYAKVFIEGLEVPLIGATFTHTVGQASICYVDILPLKEILPVKAKTHVMIAMRDMNNPRKNYPFIKAWEGEVFGIQLSKSSDSRMITLPCIDLSGYWDNVLLYFFNTQQSLAKGAQDISGLGQDVTDAERQGFGIQATTHSLSSYFLQIMQAELKDQSKDFLDALIGVYKKMENINQFFANAEDRLRISDRIRVNSSGQIEELLEAQESLEWISGIIGQSSGFSTLRQTISKLMSLIFHDFVTMPFVSKVQVENDELRGEPLNGGSGAKKTMAEFIFKPEMYMLPPPACNIFYPEEYSQFNFSRNFLQEPTRLIYKPSLPSAFGGDTYSLEHVYEPESFKKFMLGDRDVELGEGPLETSSNQGVFGEEDTDAMTKETNQGAKREMQFLTNEEKMRGILLASEQMVPSATLFKAILDKDKQRKIGEGVANYLFHKKRFETRSINITSQLKMSVVPGFPCLILDPDDAEMSIVAYVESVTHRIYATQGGYTTVQLNYARTVDEQDMISTNAEEPPIPPWFDPEFFGVESGEKNRLKFNDGISDFYAKLLGVKGSKTVNTLTRKETMLDAVKEMISLYRTQSNGGGLNIIGDYIAKVTDREYTSLVDAMKFLGASTTSKDLMVPFVEFNGRRFSGVGASDSEQVKARRNVITRYRKRIMDNRGFRG